MYKNARHAGLTFDQMNDLSHKEDTSSNGENVVSCLLQGVKSNSETQHDE